MMAITAIQATIDEDGDIIYGSVRISEEDVDDLYQHLTGSVITELGDVGRRLNNALHHALQTPQPQTEEFN